MAATIPLMINTNIISVGFELNNSIAFNSSPDYIPQFGRDTASHNSLLDNESERTRIEEKVMLSW